PILGDHSRARCESSQLAALRRRALEIRYALLDPFAGRPYAATLVMTSTTSLVAPEASLEVAATRALRYVADARELVGGNRVALLRDGRETFPAWLAAIDAARERVSLEMYIFQDDSIGRRFAEALMAAASRGVTVRLLYDFVGCRDTPA